jgi:NIPSNAP
MGAIDRRSILLSGAVALAGSAASQAYAAEPGGKENVTRLYELRNYLLKPGEAGTMVKAASTIEHGIRGDKYGRLEGYWSTDIGLLNQVINLWSYADFNDRAQAHAELARNVEWTKEYLPVVSPVILRLDIRLLNAVKSPVAPASPGNVYELRNFRAKPGAAEQWLDIFMAALPARERHSKIVGLWQTDASQPNEICHLWAYKSMNERVEASLAWNKEPEWQNFRSNMYKYLDEQNSTIMLPAPHSPLA